MEQNTQNAVAENQKQNLVAFSHKISVKLNENDFLLWKQQVLAAIYGHDLEKFISGAQFAPTKYRNFVDEEIGRVSDECFDWKKQDQLLLCWILSSMTENMLTHIGCNFTYQVWECLQSFYSSQTRAKVQQLKLQLKSIKKEGMQTNDYLLKIKSTVDAPAAVGFPLSTNDHLKAIFEGLYSDHDPFITSISTRLAPCTVSHIESLLLAQESRIERHLKPVETISINAAQNRNFQSGRGASSGSFTNFCSNQSSNDSNKQGFRGEGYQGRNRGGSGRFNPGRSQIICQLCNKAGHSVWNCFYRFDQSFQGFSNQQNSNAQNHTFRPQGQAAAMLATPEIIQDGRWYPDFGASNHVTPDSHNLMHKAEYHGPEQVQVANGAEKMNDSNVKNMPTATFIPTAATKLLPPAVTVREERSKLVENPENGHTVSITICNQNNGDTEANLAQVINHYVKTLSHSKMHILGYPTNLDFDYGALAQLLDFHINNAGDPFIGNCFALNSAAFEVCVLDWFANLWEIEKNHYWGYMTTGGTEGNLHGILVGREQLPDGILYTSQDSHYSVFKIAKMYRMQCVKVATLTSGEINCADLKSSLLAHKDKPAIINLNIGTTMKGAVDDLDLVVQTLEESGFPRDRFYIHCDGALFGMMLPFVKRAPRISFKKPIGSITVSGHKFLGCPIPCGVVITRLEYINALSSDVEIIASRDATITGSRGGHAPIFLWYALNKKGLKGLKKEVHKCMANARYLQNRLRDAGIGAMMNEFSSTVVFERPQDDGFARRWNLACKGNIAHIVVMQHVSIEMLDSFVNEFVQKCTLCYQDGQNHEPLCIAEEVGVGNCACELHSSLSW